MCPGSNYGSNSDSKCKPCNAACMSCNGGGANNCFTCNYPTLVKSGNTCALTCIAGYGITSNEYSCVRCSNTCTQCAYLGTNCTACQTTGSFSAFLYDDNLTFPKCMTVCPAGSVGVNATRTCNLCAIGCATCVSVTTNCTSCIATYGLLNSTCYSICPNKYYLSGGNCLSCNPYCMICSATNSTCS
jgi:proprotein convertase subtilisin/kexin type 5